MTFLSARRFRALAATISALLALPAAAEDLVPPDPWQIIHKVREFGPAEVGRDDFRDPLITAGLAGGEGAVGLPYEVAFYGCSLGRNCRRILLTLRLSHEDWAEAPPEAGLLAEWNATRLVGRAWLDGGESRCPGPRRHHRPRPAARNAGRDAVGLDGFHAGIRGFSRFSIELAAAWTHLALAKFILDAHRGGQYVPPTSAAARLLGRWAAADRLA